MLLAEQVKVWRKAERARLIAERTAQSLERRRAVRQRVQELLVGEVPSLRTAMLGFYWPFRAEVDLVRLVRELSGGGSGAALPVVVAKRQPLEFWRWAPGMAMQPGIWDIPVPAVAERVRPELLLVPLVGFDESGYRLGYGGGYYDRTLASMPRRPLAIGVGCEFQRIATIHPQPFDVPMDAIVTEAGIRWHNRPAPDSGDEPIECSSPPCLLGEF